MTNLMPPRELAFHLAPRDKPRQGGHIRDASDISISVTVTLELHSLPSQLSRCVSVRVWRQSSCAFRCLPFRLAQHSYRRSIVTDLAPMTHTTSALDCASFSSPMASSSSTPDSSPPPLSATMDESTAVSESMRREEAKMLQAREQDDADNEKRMDEERRKDLAAGSEALDKKHKALDFLLQQSKVS